PLSARTFTAPAFITVSPTETWPSPPMASLPSRRTARMVVAWNVGSGIGGKYTLLRGGVWPYVSAMSPPDGLPVSAHAEASRDRLVALAIAAIALLLRVPFLGADEGWFD